MTAYDSTASPQPASPAVVPDGRRRRWWLLAGFMAFAAALVWVMREPLLQEMAKWLDVGQPPQNADYVMLLNGDENTRPFSAAALVKSGFAKSVLITELKNTSAETGSLLPPYHEINRQAILKRGIAPGDITILPGSASTTRDEAEALAAFLQDRPNARVLVVTSDYHTRRTRWVFRATLGAQSRRLSFVSAPSDGYNRDRWWQDEEGFLAIGSEYLKLPFYLVCYGYLGYWLAACGGLAIVATCARWRESSS